MNKKIIAKLITLANSLDNLGFFQASDTLVKIASGPQYFMTVGKVDDYYVVLIKERDNQYLAKDQNNKFRKFRNYDEVANYVKYKKSKTGYPWQSTLVDGEDFKKMLEDKGLFEKDIRTPKRYKRGFITSIWVTRNNSNQIVVSVEYNDNEQGPDITGWPNSGENFKNYSEANRFAVWLSGDAGTNPRLNLQETNPVSESSSSEQVGSDNVIRIKDDNGIYLQVFQNGRGPKTIDKGFKNISHAENYAKAIVRNQPDANFTIEKP